MESCREFELDDVMAITAIPVADYDQWNDAALQPLIPVEDFSPVLTNAITVGLVPATAGGALVPIIRHTGKAKDTESDSVAGRRHAVDVDCEVDDRESEAWPLLRTLERTPRHLLLTFRNNRRAFVAATEDTYLCSVSRDGAKTSLSFRVDCLSGIQLIVGDSSM